MESKKEVNWAPLDDGDKNSILALRLGFRVQGSGFSSDGQTDRGFHCSRATSNNEHVVSY